MRSFENRYVLDATEGVVGAIATRLLADLGAVVVRRAPTTRENDVRWRILHRGKRTTTDDLATCLNADSFDLTVVDRLDALAFAKQSATTATTISIRLAHNSAMLLADGDLPDYALSALGGLTFITGDPRDRPMTPGDHVASHFCALHVAILAVSSMVSDGAPRSIDVSARECLAACLESTLPMWFVDGNAVKRAIDLHDLAWPTSAYRTADHWVGISCGVIKETRRLLSLLGLERLLAPEIVSYPDIPDLAPLEAELAKELRSWNTDVLVDACQEAGVAAASAATPSDLIKDAQALSRGFIGSWPDGTPILLSPVAQERRERPTPPPPRPIGRISELGTRTRHPTSPTPDAGPLAGHRVLDLTWALAGPFATMMLADLGADVVKVESRSHLDGAREVGPYVGGVSIDTSGYYWFFNRNKRSVQCDLGSVEGQTLIRRLAASASIAVENFRPHSLEGKHLGYQDLVKENANLAMCSISGFGRYGPRAGWRSYGAGMAECASGLAMATGGNRPIVPGRALSDIFAGLYSALAMCAQLHEVKWASHGTYLDLSQFETGASALDQLVAAGPDPGERHEVVGSDDDGWTASGEAGKWPVLDASAVAEHIEESGLLQRLNYGSDVGICLGLPAVIDGRRLPIRRAAAPLGGNTTEVMQECGLQH